MTLFGLANSSEVRQFGVGGASQTGSVARGGAPSRVGDYDTMLNKFGLNLSLASDFV